MNEGLKKFLNEEQDPKAIEKFAGKLESFLMSGEEIQYIAVQKKPAVNFLPDCVALTNKRVIFCRTKNLGLSVDFHDYAWHVVSGSQIKEGMLGAEFSLTTTNGQTNAIDYLPKIQARKIYSIAQEQQELQREDRFQREFEERRLAAINAVAGIPAQPTDAETPNEQPAVTPQAEDLVAVLQKFKMLLEKGLINQDEFDAKKAEILARM
jgi:hypothetical protein